MQRQLLIAVATVALIALAGCASTGMELSDAVNGSASVDDATISHDGEQLRLHLYLNDTIDKNDEVCTTTYNPALGTSTTTCSDNWHTVELTGVTVEQVNGTYSQEFDATAGDKLTAEIPYEDASYRFSFHSADSPDTWFQVTIEVGEGQAGIKSAGYNDDY